MNTVHWTAPIHDTNYVKKKICIRRWWCHLPSTVRGPCPSLIVLHHCPICFWTLPSAIGKLSFCASDDDDKLPVKLAGIALQSPPLTSEAHSKVLPWGEPLNKCEKPKTFPTNPLLVFIWFFAIFILFQTCYMNLLYEPKFTKYLVWQSHNIGHIFRVFLILCRWSGRFSSWSFRPQLCLAPSPQSGRCPEKQARKARRCDISNLKLSITDPLTDRPWGRC